MRRIIHMLGVAALLLMLAALTAGCAYSSEGDKAVFGGNETIHAGEVVDGDVAVFGGNVVVEEGARVNGDVAVFGGTVSLDGDVSGDIVNFGGTITRGENAEVGGEIATFGGTTRRPERAAPPVAPEAPTAPEIAELPELPELPEAPEAPEVFVPRVEGNTGRPSFTNRVFDLVGSIVSTVLKTIAFGALGLVLAIFLPDHVRRVSRAAGDAPAASMGVGCLAIPALVVLMVITAITIVGIPLTLLLGAASVAAGVLGWIGIGLFVGDRLLRAADIRSPRPAAAAAIGSGSLVLASSVIGLAPIFGWLVSPILGVWALGAAVLTRGGTQDYPARRRVSGPVPPPSFDPLAGVPPTPRRESTGTGGSSNLFADLAADLGIEDEVYGDDDEPEKNGPETPVYPPDKE